MNALVHVLAWWVGAPVGVCGAWIIACATCDALGDDRARAAADQATSPPAAPATNVVEITAHQGRRRAS